MRDSPDGGFTDKERHDWIIVILKAILNPLESRERVKVDFFSGLHKGATQMNFDKWIDDLKKARRSKAKTSVHLLPLSSHDKFHEGGYTSLEYGAHSAKANGAANISLGGGPV
jgi:hypothetical protein